jgi:hypothetical protein
MPWTLTRLLLDDGSVVELLTRLERAAQRSVFADVRADRRTRGSA